MSANLRRKLKQKRITDFFGKQSAPLTSKIPIADGKILCFQINNQKRIESSEKIAHYCDDNNLFLVLGQEPSTYGNGVTGLNNRHVETHTLNDKP